jgi:PST family polysaccharide transporter
VILLFVLVRGGHDILRIPTSFFIGYVAAAAFLIIIFFKKYKLIRLRFSWNFWRHLLTISTPVGLATIFNQVSLNLPPLVLGIVHTKSEVGFFSAGFKVISMFLIVERVFHYVFFPIITKQHTTTPEKLSKSFTFLTKFLFAITIPVAFGGYVLATSIIQFIFGAGYEGTIIMFRILLLYFVITPINTIFGYGLVAMDQERRFFKVISITAFINLILIVFLGINFKGAGAAAALFVSEVIGIVLMNRELRKFVSFKSMTYMVKPLLASCVMATILYVLRYWYILILVVLGLLVYVLTFYVIKGFTREELTNIKLTVMGN